MLPTGSEFAIKERMKIMKSILCVSVSLLLLALSLSAQAVLHVHNGHQYLVSNVAMTQPEAVAFAQSVGGYLVSINDAAENQWISQTFLTAAPAASQVIASALWIGLSDAAVEGTFVWASGEAVTFTNWAPGEPNNLATGQDHAVMWTVAPNADGNTWDDNGAPLASNMATRALVEVPVAPMQPSPPSGGPIVWNGHTYIFSTTTATFAQARATATAAGGHLVTINDAAENVWLTQQTTSRWGSVSNVWMGFTDELVEGTWGWDSGEPVTFTNWWGSEPNNAGSGEDYGQFWEACPPNSYGRTWNDHGAPANPSLACWYVVELPSIAPPPPPQSLPVHNGHQYMLSTAPMTWSEAQAAAVAAGGYLVSVNTAAENQFLSTVLLPGSTTNSVWMGFSDAVAEGTWVWDSGESSTFTNWAATQPDDFMSGQDYGTFKSGANNANGWTWDDQGAPLTPDFRCNAIIEIPNLTPPVVEYPATWNGHQYFMSANAMTHPEARLLARAMGGYLACPTSGEENLWITNYFGSTLVGGSLWLGGSDEIAEGTWLWDSGEPWGFSPWNTSVGQPVPGGDCLVIYDASIQNAWGCMWGTWGPPQLPSAACRALIEIPPAPRLKLECHPNIAIGDPANFSIRPNPGAPAQAWSAYVFDIGLTGTTPGLPVPGMGTIPLNGPYLGILFGPLLPNVFQNFIGLTNANGEAYPTFNYPFVPGLVGYRFDAAAATFAPTTNGLGALSNGTSFIYSAPNPVVSSISPASGTVSGGTVVTLNGERFMPGISVSFDGVAATNVAASPNGLTLVCTTPPHIVGSVSIALQNPFASPLAVPNAFTYTPNGPGPAIAGLSPNTSPIAGGGTITVNGSSFEPSSVLRVDGTNFTTTFISATQLSFTAPAHALGAAGISVYNVDGQLSATTALSYIPNLSFTAISEQIPAIGQPVTLTGDGFQQGMNVDAGGVPVPVSVTSTTSAIFVMPGGVACNSSVTLVNPSGQSANLPFNPAPTITSAFFNFGPAAGGSFFGFGGTNFVPGTTMTIDGVPTPCFIGGGNTQLGAYAPAYTGSQPLPFAAPVIITSPSGCTVNSTFTYN